MDNTNNGESPSLPGTYAGPTQTIHDQLPSSVPVEMTTFDRQEAAEDEPNLAVPAPSTGLSSSTSERGITRSVERESEQDDGKTASLPSPKIHAQVPPTSASSNPPISPTLSSASPLNREQTAPAIGPSSDKPTQIPKESDSLGPVLTITLLLTNGARHPYKIDGKYLKKRNVSVDDDNPVNMSTYTLKELIWREWRDEWEARPSSPSSIRLIYYGKLLDDKMRLDDCKFVIGTTTHVVHMTVKPQDIVDEEDAKTAKSGTRDRDGHERSPRCRCVIL